MRPPFSGPLSQEFPKRAGPGDKERPKMEQGDSTMPGGRGGGSVYFNKRLKKWVAEVRWVNEATGKVDRIVKYADSKRDAEALRAELVSQRYKGLLSTPSRATVRDFALHYLRQLESGGLKPNSFRLAGLELAYALPSLKDPTRPDPLGPMRLQEV
ncbi:MAG: hypothetical protein QXU75_06160, partial [Candidatus Methanomethylicaceae archaeon]